MKCKNPSCSFSYDKTCMRSKPCENRIAVTNADRIRAMSDEELTEFLKHWNWDNYIVMGKSVVNDWLKQEVE